MALDEYGNDSGELENYLLDPNKYRATDPSTSVNYTQPVSGSTPTAPANDWGSTYKSWIDQQLQGVQSTDDPNYWYKQASADPKFMSGDESAKNWWLDAIQRGDGSMLVKNGTLSVRPGPTSSGSGSTSGWIGSSPYASTPNLSANIGSNFQSLMNAPQASGLWGFLQSQMTQNKIPNANDPIIANQVDSFDAMQRRSGRNYLADLAERGGPNANLNGEARMVAEQQGTQSANFQAQLMQQELNARRTEIQQALQGSLGFLTEQQRMALQQELAQMDNALQYANLGQRSYEFDANDEFRRSPLAS